MYVCPQLTRFTTLNGVNKGVYALLTGTDKHAKPSASTTEDVLYRQTVGWFATARN